VCGNLKDAVGRGVDDQRARSHVLGSKFLDDFGPGRHLVSDDAPSGQPRELINQVRLEAIWEDGKRILEHDAHHFPMAGHGIFTG
jgi:hypothetical protein